MSQKPWAVWSGDVVLASEFCGMDESRARGLAENHRRKGTHDAEARPGRYRHLWGTTMSNEQWDREHDVVWNAEDPQTTTDGAGSTPEATKDGIGVSKEKTMSDEKCPEDQLREFARRVIACHTGSLDGCDIEEMAVECGLLCPRHDLCRDFADCTCPPDHPNRIQASEPTRT